MQIRRAMPAMGRIPAAEYGVTLGDFFFPVFLGERLGARLQGLALAVVGAAIVAASAQIVIPLPGTPVPITGQTFGVLLVGAALGARVIDPTDHSGLRHFYSPSALRIASAATGTSPIRRFAPWGRLACACLAVLLENFSQSFECGHNG